MKSFFDITKNIIHKIDDNLEDNPDFKKCYSLFMILRHLSCDVRLMMYVEAAQNFLAAGVNDIMIYRWLYKNVPKQDKRYFIKYDISKPKGK
jgi:hypothetical protein